MRRLIPGLFALLFLCHAHTFSQSPVHLTVKASKGDGIYRILDRYEARNPCNLTYFYQINNLKKGQGLKLGQTYKIPVLVYPYNGRSIRTTLSKNDMEWAKGIQAYNERMNALGLKSRDYRKDKKLLSYSS